MNIIINIGHRNDAYKAALLIHGAHGRLANNGHVGADRGGFGGEHARSGVDVEHDVLLVQRIALAIQSALALFVGRNKDIIVVGVYGVKHRLAILKGKGLAIGRQLALQPCGHGACGQRTLHIHLAIGSIHHGKL